MKGRKAKKCKRKFQESYILFLILKGIIANKRIARIFGILFSEIIWRFNLKEKTQTLWNLHDILGKTHSRKRIRRLGRRTIGNLFGMLLETGREKISIDETGREKSLGNGVIITSHTGSWESLNISLQNIVFVYRRMDNPYLDAEVYKRRTSQGNIGIEKRDPQLFSKLCQFLNEGKDVLIFCDQFSQEGIICPLFNRPILLSHLPLLLSRKTGKPIFPLQITPAGGKFLPCIKKIPKGKKEQGEMIGGIITNLISGNIEETLLAHSYWKKMPFNFSRLNQSLFSDKEIEKFKPHHTVITLPNDPSIRERINEILKELKNKNPMAVFHLWTESDFHLEREAKRIFPSYSSKLNLKIPTEYESELSSPFYSWINLDNNKNQIFEKFCKKKKTFFRGKTEETIEEFLARI